MEKEFIPYEQALALKELGFDNKCFLNLIFVDTDNNFYKPKDYLPNSAIWTPLYQQAFRWFREKHGYFSSPTESYSNNVKKYDWIITKEINDTQMSINFIGYRNSYEEAELECIKKLIELCKKN